MKVLLVSPLPPPTGGIATWTEKFMRNASDIDVIPVIVNNALIVSGNENSMQKRGLKNEIVRTKYIWHDFRQKFRTEKPDVVHINTSCSKFGIFRDAVCMCMAKNTPIVLHCHCNIEDQLRNKRAAIKVFTWMVKKASAVLTLNKNSADYARSVGCESVYIIPNYIESTYLNTDFKVSERIKTIVFVGHVIPTKGIMELIESAKAFPDIVFTVVGPVGEEIASVSYPENVKLIGRRTPEEVQAILRNSDVFLFPSYTEGFSIALVEAMASGLPVITTDVGANKDMIEDKGGVLVPVQSAEAISDAIRKISDSGVRQAMSSWNIEKVKTQYLQDQVLALLSEIYDGLCRCDQ